MKKLYLLAKKGEVNEEAPIIDKQEITISAPIEKVWQTLINVGEWPDWYTGVTIKKQPKKHEAGQRFSWKQNGVKIKSRLVKVEKPNTLTWTGSVLWIKAIHVWQLREIDRRKTKVTVKESLQGFFVTRFMDKQKLHKALELWLNLLKIQAERDNPPREKRLQRQKINPRKNNMLRGIHVLT